MLVKSGLSNLPIYRKFNALTLNLVVCPPSTKLFVKIDIFKLRIPIFMANNVYKFAVFYIRARGKLLMEFELKFASSAIDKYEKVWRRVFPTFSSGSFSKCRNNYWKKFSISHPGGRRIKSYLQFFLFFLGLFFFFFLAFFVVFRLYARVCAI